MFNDFERVLRFTAWAACACVVGMIGIFFATGVGQDALQFVHAPAEYQRLLLANPMALRATVGLDNFFIVFYATAFVTLSLLLVKHGAPAPLVRVSLVALLLLALLDMAENFHFLVMLAQAEAGHAPSDAEISFQVWESLLKFHTGYLGLFLLGLAIPRHTWRQRTLSFLAIYVQVPVGILIYVTPRAVAVPLVFVRFTFFVAALLLTADLFVQARAKPMALAATG